jgi:hypothetical protein
LIIAVIPIKSNRSEAKVPELLFFYTTFIYFKVEMRVKVTFNVYFLFHDGNQKRIESTVMVNLIKQMPEMVYY